MFPSTKNIHKTSGLVIFKGGNCDKKFKSSLPLTVMTFYYTRVYDFKRRNLGNPCQCTKHGP
jgi:hypothetical protein